MLYISEYDGSEVLKELDEFTLLKDMEDADKVLILPGGLGSYYDLFRAIKLEKTIYLYNKEFFYTPIIKILYEMYMKGNINKAPSEYINIESNILDIVDKIRRDENGKVNNGKNGKLL